MQGHAVVHGGRDPQGLQPRGQPIGILDANGVDRPRAGGLGADVRNGRHPGQGLVVAGGDPAPPSSSSSKIVSFSSRTAAWIVSSRPLMPMRTLSYLSRALAVHAQRAQHVGQLVVVGEERAAVAVAAERLGREEAGRRDRRQGADRAGRRASRRSSGPRRRSRTSPCRAATSAIAS